MTDFKVKVTVDGATIGQLTSTPEAQHLLDRCAQRALEFQQATVPVDTGALKQCLGIKVADDGKSRQIGAFPILVLKKVVDYAIYVEEGHRTKSGTWVHAQPFIRPSIDAAKKGLTNG